MKLYNEMLSVPLIIVGKGSERYDNFADSLVELKDIPQVILDVVGGGEMADISKEYVLSQSLRKDGENWVKLIALQNKKFKLIYDTGSEVNNEFYNLSSDPYEKNNLIHDESQQEKIEEFIDIIKDFLKVTDYRSKLINKTKGRIKKLKETMRI